MPDLRPVKRAAATVRRARDEYRRAVVVAHSELIEAGRERGAYAEIARAVGVSPQAIRVLVERAKRRDNL